MKRLAIFAHYDKNNQIEDYVVYLLETMRGFVDNILFVSDSNLPDNELSKINNYVSIVSAKHHGEYDFGSYKIGYKYALDNHLLSACEQLVFFNDSCYGPLYPLNSLFEEMNSRNVDAWGITTGFNTHFGNNTHIQSYFVALKPKVFRHDKFKYFICSVKKEENKMDIVRKYEIGLTKCIDDIGTTRDVYSEYSKHNWASYILSYKHLVKKEKVPFVKRCLPLCNTDCYVNINDFKKFIENNTNYDYKLIEEDIKNNRLSLKYNDWLRIIRKYFLRRLLNIYRRLFV